VTDFDAYHSAPRHEHLVAGRTDGLTPFAVRVDNGRAYTYVPTAAGVDVRPGVVDGAVVMDLPLEQWETFAEERWTRYGVLYHGSAAFTGGAFVDLCRWEPVLRALFDGRPMWDPSVARDQARSFTLDDADGDLAAFLQTNGYLHVQGVVGADELELLRGEVERLAAESTTDDPKTTS